MFRTLVVAGAIGFALSPQAKAVTLTGNEYQFYGYVSCTKNVLGCMLFPKTGLWGAFRPYDDLSYAQCHAYLVESWAISGGLGSSNPPCN